MKVRVIQPITTAKGTTPVGTIIDIPDNLLVKLKGKVELIDDPKKFPHYCAKSDSWCSGKLPGNDYPSACIKIKCEYHTGGHQ